MQSHRADAMLWSAWLLLLLLLCVLPSGDCQDRETLTRICDSFRAANQSAIRIGVLDKGETGFPMSAWRGVFETIATSFLSRYGCRTAMTLYSFAPLLAAVNRGDMDMILCNPIQGTQFAVQNQAKPFVSLTMQYQTFGGRLPFPGVPASLDRFGATMVYLHANTTKRAGGLPVPPDVTARRAIIDAFNVQTWDDLISLSHQLPPKNLTICAVSQTSLGGFQMAAYEMLKRNVTINSLFVVKFMNTHAASLSGAINGTCDFATTRTGTLDVAVNDTTIDPGTFTVLTNIERTHVPTPFFPLFISTPLYPEWPVLAMPTVPEALVQAFTVPLTALSILTNTPEANAVSGASFTFPFSYDPVSKLMFDLNVLGSGECEPGWARRHMSEPLPQDPTVPHVCFQCGVGQYARVHNSTSTCTPCPINTASAVSGWTGPNCTACASGFVTDGEGATSCRLADRPIVGISTTVSNAMLGVCIAVLVLLFLCWSLMMLFRAQPVMKGSSPLFLGVVLMGLAALCASIIPRTQEGRGLDQSARSNPPDASVCLADLWLANIGYTLITGGLLVKTYRLHAIFSATKLRPQTNLSNRILCIPLLLLLTAQCAVILGLTLTNPLYITVHSLDSRRDYFACSTAADDELTLENLYIPVIMAPRFVLLLATTYTAYLVKGLPAAFNESSQLLVTMYNLVFFSVLLPAIDSAVGRGKDTGLLAYSISVFLIVLLTGGIIFVPKFVHLWKKTKLLSRKGLTPGSGPINGTQIELNATAIDSGGSSPGTTAALSPRSPKGATKANNSREGLMIKTNSLGGSTSPSNTAHRQPAPLPKGRIVKAPSLIPRMGSGLIAASSPTAAAAENSAQQQQPHTAAAAADPVSVSSQPSQPVSARAESSTMAAAASPYLPAAPAQPLSPSVSSHSHSNSSARRTKLRVHASASAASSPELAQAIERINGGTPLPTAGHAAPTAATANQI